MAIEPFIDEAELESFGFCSEEDNFYRYLAVRGGMFITDNCYDGPENRMIGFNIDGINYYFDKMPLLEEGIDHVELPEEVDSLEFRQILKELFPIIPNFEDILFLEESDIIEDFYAEQLNQEWKGES